MGQSSWPSWVGCTIPLQWRHNERKGVSNHQRFDYLLNHLFRRKSKKTSKFRVTGLCEGNPPVTGGFPHKGPVTRKMSPFDDVSMPIYWWCYVLLLFTCLSYLVQQFCKRCDNIAFVSFPIFRIKWLITFPLRWFVVSSNLHFELINVGHVCATDPVPSENGTGVTFI